MSKNYKELYFLNLLKESRPDEKKLSDFCKALINSFNDPSIHYSHIDFHEIAKG